MKDFKLRRLEYAYLEGGLLVHIISANKDGVYFLNQECSIPLIFCEGNKNIRHWKRGFNVTESQVSGYFKGESLEHYNRKTEIVNKKEFKHGDYTYVGYSAYSEYLVVIEGKRKYIDAVLVDEDNNPIIGIEVYKTNKKTPDDIKLFNKLNFPIYEESTDKGGGYVISAGKYKTDDIERIRASIMDITTEVFENEGRIRKSKKPIQEIKKVQRVVKKEYYDAKRDEQTIEILRRGIQQLAKESKDIEHEIRKAQLSKKVVFSYLELL